MFRPTSEMAVAMRARSVEEKPSRTASVRAALRAVRMSASCWIGMVASADMGSQPGAASELIETIIHVQRRAGVLEPEAKARHREGHLRLNARHDRLGATEPQHACDPVEHSCCKRIHDLHRAHVDEHTPRTELTGTREQIPPQIVPARIGQLVLDGDDEVVALLE